MIRILLTVCFSLLFNVLAAAAMNSSIPQSSTTGPSIFVNGTLSITVDAAPAVGLPAPKILVMRGFVTVYQKDVNWGDTWNLNIPSGNYKIFPLPVSDGTDFYIANSIFVSVPPNTTVNSLITYHIV
ncbi:TPA: hypothetical protein KKX76_003213 [Legionella pneumophila]|uniref:hypothetical protein n=1 Tax=Legionella pneumophila TaxID=446 RepID=UPI001020FA5B|nr:hypothetical protein [Legionella pneumophila]RYX49020.1 hypothetical protein D7274_11995 [Legionella pneumophila]HAT1864013.1 hypothetical protein [Legionella pneumophila]HAU1324557.1 hypothetical protein [Legionella pneumophila]HAU1349755.1 hypothetical protein [Legionella pneumophila]HAU2320462.1 hypothetical protein [Legionella pneumophila]